MATNREILSRAFSRGRNDEAIIGYHGTSLCVLKKILNYGKQPGSSYYTKGDLPVNLCVRQGKSGTHIATSS